MCHTAVTRQVLAQEPEVLLMRYSLSRTGRGNALTKEGDENYHNDSPILTPWTLDNHDALLITSLRELMRRSGVTLGDSARKRQR